MSDEIKVVDIETGKVEETKQNSDVKIQVLTLGEIIVKFEMPKQFIDDIVEDTNKLADFGIKSVAICSNDVKNYPEDSFENMIEFSKENKFKFPYMIDETQEVAKKYDAVCTPDFFGYNKDLELQYRGRIRELKELKPVRSGESDLYKAMKQISETGKGPESQIPSMGCNIKWLNN